MSNNIYNEETIFKTYKIPISTYHFLQKYAKWCRKSMTQCIVDWAKKEEEYIKNMDKLGDRDADK